MKLRIVEMFNEGKFWRVWFNTGDTKHNQWIKVFGAVDELQVVSLFYKHWQRGRSKR